MPDHELEVENDQNDKAVLILVFSVVVVVLNAKDDEENTMVDEIAHKKIESLVYVLAPFIQIHCQLVGKCLSRNLLVFWRDHTVVLTHLRGLNDPMYRFDHCVMG